MFFHIQSFDILSFEGIWVFGFPHDNLACLLIFYRRSCVLSENFRMISRQISQFLEVIRFRSELYKAELRVQRPRSQATDFVVVKVVLKVVGTLQARMNFFTRMSTKILPTQICEWQIYMQMRLQGGSKSSLFIFKVFRKKFKVYISTIFS